MEELSCRLAAPSLMKMASPLAKGGLQGVLNAGQAHPGAARLLSLHASPPPGGGFHGRLLPNTTGTHRDDPQWFSLNASPPEGNPMDDRESKI